MSSDNILEVKNLSKVFYNQSSAIFGKSKEVKALDDVSFYIKKGEVFGLVGESGCGKSTLGRAIVKLIKDTTGEILLEETNIKNIKNLSKQVQIVFQDPLSSLNPKKKIGWILEEPLKIHKYGNKEKRIQRVNEILELIGLDESYRDRYPNELSGGQRQRISIGSALMLNPDIIIGDEPVSALDVSVQAQILNLLLDLHEKLKLSYLFISHNLDVVYYMCDRVAVMYLGKIVELAGVDEIYDNPIHPYTKALLSAIPDADPEKRLNEDEFKADILKLSQVEGGCSYYKRCPMAKDICKEKVPELRRVNNESEHLVRCHSIERI